MPGLLAAAQMHATLLHILPTGTSVAPTYLRCCHGVGCGAARHQQVAAAAQGAAARCPALRLLGNAALHAAVAR